MTNIYNACWMHHIVSSKERKTSAEWGLGDRATAPKMIELLPTRPGRDCS